MAAGLDAPGRGFGLVRFWAFAESIDNIKSATIGKSRAVEIAIPGFLVGVIGLRSSTLGIVGDYLADGSEVS